MTANCTGDDGRTMQLRMAAYQNARFLCLPPVMPQFWPVPAERPPVPAKEKEAEGGSSCGSLLAHQNSTRSKEKWPAAGHARRTVRVD